MSVQSLEFNCMRLPKFIIIPAEAGIQSIPKGSWGVLHKNFR